MPLFQRLWVLWLQISLPAPTTVLLSTTWPNVRELGAQAPGPPHGGLLSPFPLQQIASYMDC